jgi:hypothetical protein
MKDKNHSGGPKEREKGKLEMKFQDNFLLFSLLSLGRPPILVFTFS